nr:odorant receptor Or1-like [Megalopta genalis]
MSFAIDCFKMTSMLIMRKNLGTLMNTLQSAPFAPVGAEELEIQKNFHKSAEQTGKVYMTAFEVWSAWAVLVTLLMNFASRKLLQTGKVYMTAFEVWSAWAVLVTLLMNFASRKLLYRVWLPFEYNSATIYSLVYLHHTLTTLICATAVVAYDTLFTGLMIQIYSQFEILRHRLRNVHRNENDLVKHCALHHDHIYNQCVKSHVNARVKEPYHVHENRCRFANMVNNEFRAVMFIQFVQSTAVLCFGLYQLMMSELDGNLADIAFYITCLLLQIFYFCWFGNEVKLKSSQPVHILRTCPQSFSLQSLEVSDMIFEIEWTTLSNKTKKMLLMMMRRATVPIELTSLHIVSVNIESFKALIKTSYSVFNLIRQN